MNDKKVISRFMLSLFLIFVPMQTHAQIMKSDSLIAEKDQNQRKTYVFLVFGYGVPKDIFQDENYKTYLTVTFNTIFDIVEKKDTEVYVIFSGGKTDMIEPYARSEAGEMKKYFASLLERPFLKNYASKLHLLLEEDSLSTLENMLFTEKIIATEELNPLKTFIFFEKTRARRVKILAEKIFMMPLKLYPIDFDKSEQRYLESSLIRHKEKVETRSALWALATPENMQKYHELFRQRIDLLRKTPPQDRPKIQQEFRQKLEKLGKQ